MSLSASMAVFAGCEKAELEVQSSGNGNSRMMSWQFKSRACQAARLTSRDAGNLLSRKTTSLLLRCSVQNSNAIKMYIYIYSLIPATPSP